MNIERLVQIATVVSIDNNISRARVKFKDTGIISNWLSVLNNGAALLNINDTVVVLYMPYDDSEGFVLGRIGGTAT